MRYLLLSLIALASCSRPSAEAPDARRTPEYFRMDAARAGSIHGAVRFVGKKPAVKPISMDAEEACEKMQTKPVYAGGVVTGRSGGLADVFVYIKSGLEGKTFEPVKHAVVLDQRGCQFVPRVIALRAGQTLTVKNSDPVSHNIHPRPRENREWNQQQSPGAPDLQRRFARPEVMIPVKCNVHAWMRSHIGVLDHPYFAVTDDSGSFNWPAVPPGDYVVAAWHGVAGEITEDVRIAKGSTREGTFTLRIAPEQK